MEIKIKHQVLFIVFFPFTFFYFSCQEKSFNEPIISLDTYQVEAGFELSIAASEPFLEAPVTMDFDNRGRMWVAEMRGYMMNLEGIGENEPNGRITILEDQDYDGITDHNKIFLDSLVLPRAIAHVYGGLLYATPPNLWFAEIVNDKPGKITLVDSIYADAGNVEHQPNGLLMNIDNWIYNANSNFRYQRKNGSWIKEPTSYRGQWGISKDNFGRLYYNSNSNQIKGDFVLPNTVIQNQYFIPKESINQTLTANQRVYPLHATSVNRGYNPGILDENMKLVNVTSACGPLVYRGGQFPGNYDHNAFVCVPEANLIKRNLLSFENIKISAQQAWDDKEFIASTDEGFRPVNLFNGPDGSIYIVDMHRGVIQHKAFISQYLTKQLADKKLDTIIGMGRILKVRNTSKPLGNIPDLSQSSEAKLLGYLRSTNGWIRDKAQQQLIDRQERKVIPDLKSMVQTNDPQSAQIHALYALQGLNAVTFDFLQEIALDSSMKSEIIAHILLLTKGFASNKNIRSMLTIINTSLNRSNPIIDYYLAAALNPWIKVSENSFLPILSQISNRYPESSFHQEAVISSLVGFEENYLESFNPIDVLRGYLNLAIQNKEDENLNSIFVNVSVNEDNRTNGLKLFRSICAVCHGPSGDGIPDLGPPLRESEYVTGSILRLASIMLHGMSGPVHVNNQLYEMNLTMPGVDNNSSLSDQDIVDIINFLQNAFVHDRKDITTQDIRNLRQKKPKNGYSFTEKELLGMDFLK